MTLALQLSDPHFGTALPPVVAGLERLVAARRPDLLLLSGDITQRATAAEFAQARAFVDRLAVPRVLAVPGNHDIPLFDLPRRLLQPYGRFRRAFGPALEPVHDSPSLLVLGVNTTRWWRHVEGTVSAAQVARVEQRLLQAGPVPWKLLLLHHPLAVPRLQDSAHLPRGHAEALRRWRKAGADIVLGGHIHLPALLPRPTPGGGPVTWVVLAGTATSHRVRAEAGNSVNFIEVGDSGPRRACIERWDWQAGSQRFACVARQWLPAGGVG